MSTRDKLNRLTELVDKVPATLPARKDRHVTAPAQLLAYSGELQEAIAERDRLRAQLSELTGDNEVALSDLAFGPQHYLPVKTERVQELAEHLKSNNLHNPILVRKLRTGQLEVLAGRHRVEAYRLLGRHTIPARLIDVPDAEAESLVVFDNLMAPQLADFEVYLGLAKLKASRDLSSEGVAELSGISKARVSRLFAFEDAPGAVLSLLKQVPAAVTAYQAGELRRRKLWSHERLGEGVERIRDGSLRSAELLAWLARNESPAQPNPPQERVVTVDNVRFATVTQSGRGLKIALCDAAAADSCLEAVLQTLETLAKSSKAQQRQL